MWKPWSAGARVQESGRALAEQLDAEDFDEPLRIDAISKNASMMRSVITLCRARRTASFCARSWTVEVSIVFLRVAGVASLMA